MLYKNLKVGYKIASVFIAVVLVLTALTIFINVEVNELNKEIQKLGIDEKERNELVVRSEQIKQTMWVGVIVGFVILLTALTTLYKSTVNPLGKIKTVIEEITSGNFTAKANLATNDEIGSIGVAVDALSKKLHNVVTGIESSAEVVMDSSSELSASAEETRKAVETVTKSAELVAESSSKTQQELENVAVNISKIAGNLTGVKDNASELSEKVASSEKNAVEGGKIVEESTNQMKLLSESVIKTDNKLKELVAKASEVGIVIETIKSISDQTNLLSLNASIEAARAGETGKGFAVVADEVRKLAEESLKAAKTVDEILKAIANETKLSSQEMSVILSLSDKGLVVSEASQAKFLNIMEEIKEITPKIKEIDERVEAINEYSNRTNTQMTKMLGFAKENSEQALEMVASAEEQLAAVEQVSASSDALTGLSQELSAIVKTLK